MGQQLNGGTVSRLTFTHAGAVSTDDEVMPPGVPANFLFINEAANKYVVLGDGKREYGEALYRRLYDELVANEKEWMDVSVEMSVVFSSLNVSSEMQSAVLSLPTK